jgi:hypothetical protein
MKDSRNTTVNTYFGCPVWIVRFSCSRTFKLFDFSIIWPWVWLMKVLQKHIVHEWWVEISTCISRGIPTVGDNIISTTICIMVTLHFIGICVIIMYCSIMCSKWGGGRVVKSKVANMCLDDLPSLTMWTRSMQTENSIHDITRFLSLLISQCYHRAQLLFIIFFSSRTICLLQFIKLTCMLIRNVNLEEIFSLESTAEAQVRL